MIQNSEIEWFLANWLKEFLEESIVTDWNKEQFIKYLIAKPNEVFNRIRKNINKSYDSIYDNIKIRDEDVSQGKIPFSTILMLLSEKYWTNWPMDILNNYTLEQYEWMLEGMRFYNYEQDKKLSIYNRKAMAIKYNEKEKNKELMEYARRGPTKEFLDEYFAKNG